MIKGFSPRAQKLLSVSAVAEVRRFKGLQIQPEHVMLAMIKLAEGVGYETMNQLYVNILMFQLALEQAVSNYDDSVKSGFSSNAEVIPSRRLKTLLDMAAVESRSMRCEYVGTEHIFLAALREENSVTARFFQSIPVTVDVARKMVLKAEEVVDTSALQTSPSASNAEAGSSKGAQMPGNDSSGKQKQKASLLKEFSRDLTENARSGLCDPVIGREREIQRVIQILCRRNKNNPVLIGEPGVGKTAIVEGLAQRIVAEQVPGCLVNKRVLVLDLALVIAGTKYRGEFEERIKGIVKEIAEQKNIILFIDELHTLIGAGGAEGSMDASNMLKPALARGELQCIGATTIKEYRKYFEKDAALERRFQMVMVNEPDDADTLAILYGIKPKYEEFHHVKYAEGVLELVVRFARRYITERFLPDKAIDLLDEAGAMKKIEADERPAELAELEQQIALLTEEKQLMEQSQNYERCAEVRDEVRILRMKAEQLEKNNVTTVITEKNTVTPADICTVVSTMTGIPMDQLDTAETERLLDMEKEIHKTVIAQDEAVSLISSAVRRARAGVSSFKRPQGSFIFLGPTGVGKTLLAKTLATFLFGSEEALIRVDMSDFMEKHTASRLVGAPPGYVGYEEGGVLTEKVRRKPYCVVLLDEIEKAHPDIFNLLLQVLEEGELRDNLGHTVSFRNAVIIMTSNAGVRRISNENSLGFSSNSSGIMSYDSIKADAMNELKRILNPELLNRIDDVVVFNALSEEEVSAILDLQIDEFRKRIAEKGLDIELKPSARRYFIENGYDPAFGARPMRRLIQRELEDATATLILQGKCKKGSILVAEAKNDKLVLGVKAEADKEHGATSSVAAKKSDKKRATGKKSRTAKVSAEK
ncbi:MAG: ATP-dependent Clp protease ATP-binding subunit [Treponemataceae bacterium]|nr:ATP-dependent Clp protease ATP-binding subunit [Treponemataceae bacterium]